MRPGFTRLLKLIIVIYNLAVQHSVFPKCRE